MSDDNNEFREKLDKVASIATGIGDCLLGYEISEGVAAIALALSSITTDLTKKESADLKYKFIVLVNEYEALQRLQNG